MVVTKGTKSCVRVLRRTEEYNSKLCGAVSFLRQVGRGQNRVATQRENPVATSVLRALPGLSGGLCCSGVLAFGFPYCGGAGFPLSTLASVGRPLLCDTQDSVQDKIRVDNFYPHSTGDKHKNQLVLTAPSVANPT